MRRPHWLRAACLTMPLAVFTIGTVQFIELHGPDGQLVMINTHEITSLRQPTSFDMRRYFTKGARCIVITAEGRFIAVVESCQTIREQISAPR